MPAFAGDAAVVRTRNAIVTRARDARARAAEAAIADGAAVAVVAGGPALSGGIATGARRGIARSGGVALIERGADHWVDAHAAPVLAAVGLRAGVAVVAGRAVGLVRRRRAHAGGGVAGAGVVALVRRADHRACSDAAPVLAGVGLRAGVAVVAGRAVGLVRRRRAHAGGGVAGAGVVALVRRADHRACSDAAPVLAGVGLRAGVAVVAGRAVGLVRRRRAHAGGGVAGAGVVALDRRADHRACSDAAPVLAGVGLRAGVAVVAGRAVGLVRRRRAHAGGGVAGPGVVARVPRADHRACSDAAPVLAGVGLRAGVAVVAGRAVGLVRRRRAHAGGGVAGAGAVALVRRADHRACSDAAPVLAGVGLRAGVAVVAGRAVCLVRRRRAHAGGGV